LSTIAIVVLLGVMLHVRPAPAGEDDDHEPTGRFCSATTTVQLEACQSQVNADFFTAKALCMNVVVDAERRACFRDAQAARRDGSKLCREQRRAREDVCAAIGQARYDANFDPMLFDHDFRKLTHPNPYFPLGIGNQWKYASPNGTVVVEVLDKTKLVQGVTCIVVNDLVEQDGEVIEDTDDWFGQRKDGTVDYCGESVRNLETFAGDHPAEPELVDVHGSWKAGRGALPGTSLPGSPVAGRTHRQEFRPGVAEDIAKVLSTTYSFGHDPELDELVPRALAERLCAADCLVTRESTPIEPGKFQRKYYARGIGLFLDVTPETGKVVRLTECNFGSRCASVPKP
jgi:hypothetical protein